MKMREMRQCGEQKNVKPLRLVPTTNPNIKGRRTKADHLNKSWKLLPVMKLGYVTRKRRLRTLQRTLTRPIKEDLKNKITAL